MSPGGTCTGTIPTARLSRWRAQPGSSRQRGAQPTGALLFCGYKTGQFPPIKHILIGGTPPCFPVKPERRGWECFNQVAVHSLLGGQMEGLVLWPHSSGAPDSPWGTFCTLVLQPQASGSKGSGCSSVGLRGQADLVQIILTSILAAQGGRVYNHCPTLQVRKLKLRERATCPGSQKRWI